jgi:hypothetical protein
MKTNLSCFALLGFLSLNALVFAAAPPTKPAATPPPAPAKTVRLLTIGNSFSANATKYLDKLATAGGYKVIHRPIVVGGAPLELHAGKAQKFERDPKDKDGLYTNGKGLKEQLLMDRWDFVTIQQASIKSHDLATYQPHATWLRDYVKKHAPQAELLMHQTWAYRRDDPRFSPKTPKLGEPVTQEAMYQGLSNAYGTVAKELGVRRIPVGDAFYQADTDPKWGYQADTKFDSKTAKPSELPNQTHSLHMGWQWKKGTDGKMTLGMDGHHANTAGEYLGGCVFYEVLFGESVVGNSFVPPGLDADYARYLQQTAHDAVAKAGSMKTKSDSGAPAESKK